MARTASQPRSTRKASVWLQPQPSVAGSWVSTAAIFFVSLDSLMLKLCQTWRCSCAHKGFKTLYFFKTTFLMEHQTDSTQYPFGAAMWPGELPGCGCRSEEHTSELQSLRHLVCRLLLEKKDC